MEKFSQNYDDPLFIEQERDKIALEVVSAFKSQLARFPYDSKFSLFLRSRGLYAGPYADSSEAQREKFSRVAENTHASSGPRYTAGVFGPKVFVPGMAKHAFNSAAAEINGAIAGADPKDIQTYKENSHQLARMAWKVSAAIEGGNLNYALSAIYGSAWDEFDPHRDSRPGDIQDNNM